jgi:aspartate aminotransferase
MKPSTRILSIEGSKTARFLPLLQQMRSEGKKIINLAVGEPEYPTSTEVIAATRKALSNQKTRYGDVAGLLELRKTLARRFDGMTVENIIISNGAKQCLYNIFQVICNPLDEVILPVPCWVSFAEQIRLAGAVPVFVPVQGSCLDLDAIASAITPKTKAILINSPNNPTGAVYLAEELSRIAELADTHDLFVVADEAYQSFIYDGITFPSLFDQKEIRSRLIIIRSFSKQYNMTGFRIGYAVANAKITAAMIRLQSHLCGNVCTFAQHGAFKAATMDRSEQDHQLVDLTHKRDLAYEVISRHFKCDKPKGAFYLFPYLGAHLAKGQSDQDFAAHLLERTGVAVVPGEAFFHPGYIRICYAVPEDQLISALKKIEEVL